MSAFVQKDYRTMSFVRATRMASITKDNVGGLRQIIAVRLLLMVVVVHWLDLSLHLSASPCQSLCVSTCSRPVRSSAEAPYSFVLILLTLFGYRDIPFQLYIMLVFLPSESIQPLKYPRFISTVTRSCRIQLLAWRTEVLSRSLSAPTILNKKMLLLIEDR
jgi:hypothetical protein